MKAPLLTAALSASAAQQLYACGDAFYEKTKYTCYDGNFLCPVIDGTPTLRCGPDCYLASMYSCAKDHLMYPPTAPDTSCLKAPTTQYLVDEPYSNYFYSDCLSASTVVVTMPQPDSNLTLIGPRLLVAWPAGNSGAVTYFASASGINGTLEISLVNGSSSFPLQGTYASGNYSGVSTLLHLNDSAILTIPILGSIRSIRDFVEGPSILVPEIQDAIVFEDDGQAGVKLSRTWLDNITTTVLSFTSVNGTQPQIDNRTVRFQPGTYNFTATFNYPQLDQLDAQQVLNNRSQGLIQADPDRTTSLSFLSYSTKLLAGTWRFLTYFGRDSMISLLLLQDVLSEGEGGAIEAVISSVLERANRTDGSLCHEEAIGDYATYLNMQNNISSTAPVYDYKMIDTDFYLPVVMKNYFIDSITGRTRRDSFLATVASVNPANAGLTHKQLAQISADKIMNISAPFAATGGQTEANLIHLKPDQIVGEWRDSTYGIGGGRIPYDVNTALVPAALRAIAALSSEGVLDRPEWSTTAADYAKTWEDKTLAFFEVTVPRDEARELVDNYTSTAGFGFPSNSSSITGDIHYHGLALQGNSGQELVKVMNTDDCFRHFLLNTTDQAQLTAFVNQTANNILLPYPVGLSNPIGLLVANPAYGGDPVYAQNFSNNAYHGTVCWGWQMAMMAAGLERQIGRCSSSAIPEFCSDTVVRMNVVDAYDHLWDLIEANSAQLSSEVWSWTYDDDGFQVASLGSLPPPPGVNPTESDIRQLWSLTFLAVKRNSEIGST